ncbi:MAG: cytosine/adenosine deaminase [Solidesulfovibrio magneticus str. Maddingley MBC34]|uniref:tRNA-specific adenosine deaminase n=1 Tax=Solidesulfovibrio magneticus str. Maddingley MBC34 TaxID=1206767 RepID=K6GRU5_9BACT|nr:MAG: cytosine/adenosine deaminase [Solidesulfovibrio magneticus str. Maddingley MBC34]
MALLPAKRFDAASGELPAPPPGWPDFEAVMALALDEARAAATLGETPVGAVLLSAEGELLARAGNAPITTNDPTAHAEMRVLRQAAATVGNYRLSGTILAVTLEPCLMCLGAMIHARVGLLVYGATDPRTGVVDSRLPGPDLPFFNHRFDVVSGIRAGECGGLLRAFFREKRRGGAG